MTDLPPAPPTEPETPSKPSEDPAQTALCCLLAIVFPPLGAFLKVGFSGHLWLNILLTLFGYLPGVLHALWVVIRKEQEQKEEEQVS